MKSSLSRTQAREEIELFFKKPNFSSDEVRKIKRLAMKHRIRLGSHKRKFCKKCLSQLRGKIRISKFYKTIECRECGCRNKFKIQA